MPKRVPARGRGRETELCIGLLLGEGCKVLNRSSLGEMQDAEGVLLRIGKFLNSLNRDFSLI